MCTELDSTGVCWAVSGSGLAGLKFGSEFGLGSLSAGSGSSCSVVDAGDCVLNIDLLSLKYRLECHST